MIKLRSLTKQFGSSLILGDVNLEIKDGSIFGLVGPNGAGKSTLLRIISGIMKPEIGCVLIDDEKVYENPNVKKDILFISDDPFFFYNASIRDLKAFYEIWYPKFNNDDYYTYLKIFGLDEKKPLKNFSKGMKRQSFIVLALAIAPKYLLLDEAFDGLDPIMRLTFKRAITKLIEEKKMTVIISSHNLRELEDICDSFGILENGVISTSGDIDEAKESVHKVQIAFRKEKTEEDFKELDLLAINIQSRVVNMVVKGDIVKIEQYLNTMDPLMMDILNVNLEEIFIYEMERKGYGVHVD